MLSENQNDPVEAFLTALPDKRQAEARVLDRLFRKVTGFEPYLSSGSIIGYGRYHYVYDSGREGECQATGFSPRAAKHSIYIMPGYADFGNILDRLGKHKMGKACLYVNKLADVDLNVLRELISAGLDDLNQRWTVEAT